MFENETVKTYVFDGQNGVGQHKNKYKKETCSPNPWIQMDRNCFLFIWIHFWILVALIV